ncbi:MAG: hypothetical protein R3F61_38340 [Myxococcota bacterium]
MLLTALLSCSSPEVPPVLAERTAQTEVRRAVAANETLSCVRPVLRGAARPGPAMPDLLALWRPDDGGPVGSCLEAVAASPRSWGLAGQIPFHDGYARDRLGDLDAMHEVCAGLPAVLSAAVSHEDSCSPYLLGREAAPSGDRMLALTRMSTAIVIEARARALAGDPGGAMGVLLDGVRAGQDLGRGGPSLLVTLLGTSAANDAATAGHRVLALEGWTDEALAAVDAELAALQESAVHPSVALEGEALFVLERSVAAAAPGGPTPEAAITGDPRRDAELALQALLATRERWRTACPPTATLGACLDGLSAEQTRMVDAKEEASKRLQSLGSPPWDVPPGSAHEDDVRVLLGSTFAQMASRLESAATLQSTLGLLRVHVAVKRGRCTEPEVASLLEPPGLGMRLRFESTAVPTADGGSRPKAAIAWPPEALAPFQDRGLESWRCGTP